jgi:hypothetical protein
MGHQSTYEPYYLELGGKKIADIVITHHAKVRWTDRVEQEKTGFSDICAYLWGTLKNGTIKPYYKNEQEVYLVEEDLVMVAEFTQLEQQFDITGKPLYKMIVVTFLGRMSEMIELRDLKSYYSWLRHSRRMTLIKNGRKRK